MMRKIFVTIPTMTALGLILFLGGCKQKNSAPPSLLPDQQSSGQPSISAQANQECECVFASSDCTSSPKEVSLKVTCPNIQGPHCHQEIEKITGHEKPYRLTATCEVPPEDGDDNSIEVVCEYRTQGCHLVGAVK